MRLMRLYAFDECEHAAAEVLLQFGQLYSCATSLLCASSDLEKGGTSNAY